MNPTGIVRLFVFFRIIGQCYRETTNNVFSVIQNNFTIVIQFSVLLVLHPSQQLSSNRLSLCVHLTDLKLMCMKVLLPLVL